MKKLREIAYKTLVENFNVSANLLSRIEGDEPIEIELNGGEVIFISRNERTLQTCIEIPFFDQRVLKLKASKIIESLMSDDEVFLNIKKDRLIVVTEFSADSANVERVWAKKLTLFNDMATYIKV